MLVIFLKVFYHFLQPIFLRLKIDINEIVTFCNARGVIEFKSRILSYLIGKGVSTTKVCDNRYTPIKLSMMVGKHENASFLLNHGAKIDADLI